MNFATLAFGALLGKRLPRYEGSVRVGVRRSVEIRRDRWGVAYIDAVDEHDAWFGLGFCHGQDRSGQLEVTVRLVRGTLASAIGTEGLPIDRTSRLIGVRRAAERQYRASDHEVQAQLQAYCEGVNAALTTARRSHEHVLLRTRPTPWEPADVIAFGLMMCCLLPSNWDAELARLLVLTRDGPEAVEALDPSYPVHLPVTWPPGQPAGAPAEWFLSKDLLRFREFLGASGGSNAWAVSGARSATGRPLLANDPHLPASLPNFGYLTRVKCPAFSVAGISIVGVPAFLSGHNGRVAWGATAANVDNTDLFLEELGPEGRSVRQGDSFVPCDVVTELIDVRGAARERLPVVLTPRGPIVARADDPERSIFDPAPFRGRPNAISFAATWLRDSPTRALLRLHTVRSFTEFRDVCALATGCAYSLIYADPSTVGWVLAAEVPRRVQGFGSLPMPGWAAHSGWDGVVTSSELPYGHSPSAGYVAAANNRPTPDRESPVYLGHDFLDGYRQQRISSVLAAREDWTVQRMLELQLDVVSVAWLEIRASVLALQPVELAAVRALDLLRVWDGRLSSESSAASVYELFLAEMCQRICRVKAPNSWRFAAGQGVMKLIPGTTFNARRLSFVTRLLLERPSGYFESWTEEIADALATTVRSLEELFGADARGWAWGKIRPLRVAHRFGGKKPLDRVYDVAEIPGYGDGGTVNQAGFEFWHPLRHSTVTAHCRSVIDVGDWGASRFVLLGGQSGNPVSKNYANLIPLWQRGDGVPIHFDDAAVRQHAVERLVLVPAPSSRLPDADGTSSP